MKITENCVVLVEILEFGELRQGKNQNGSLVRL